MKSHRPAARAAATTGLLLTGGGARAAYQVGVLEALADLCCAFGPLTPCSPFGIITGTSAGAINAAALASRADDFTTAVRCLGKVWRHFHAGQVYRADALGVAHSGARWLGLLSLGWMVARWRRLRPRSLLDNAPLGELLRDLVHLERLPGLIGQGCLQALAVSASSYSSGQHISFFDGRPGLAPWTRSQRQGLAATLTHDHLLASSAIPFVFPAVALPAPGGSEYFGDGSMRQSAPIAPAIHLGAQRVLVVGAGRMHEPRDPSGQYTARDYPSLAQIAGHAMSNIFLDALSVDVERVNRINQTLALIPPAARQASHLKPVELLVIAPTRRLDEVAARHLGALPAPVRAMLAGLGVSSAHREVQSAALASYLLFEADYTQELMGLGYDDTWRRRDEVCRFFGWPGAQTRQVRQTPQAPQAAQPLRQEATA